MKELSLTEVFCEVLGGLALLALLVPVFDLAGILALEQTWALVAGHLSLTLMTGAFVAAYLAGLLVDAVSLCIGEWFLDGWLADPGEAQAATGFWAHVTEHVLQYWERQWTYYSCYRNLAIMALPAGLAWALVAWGRGFVGRALLAIGLIIVAEVFLVCSMRTLLRIYYKIVKSVAAGCHEAAAAH